MKLHATLRGVPGTIKVGRKYITFNDIKIGDISSSYDGSCMVRIQISIGVGKGRKEATTLALRKAGYKII